MSRCGERPGCRGRGRVRNELHVIIISSIEVREYIAYNIQYMAYRMRVCIYIYRHTYAYIYIYIYTYMPCTYIYRHIQT